MIKNKPACDCAKMENFQEKQPEAEKEKQIIEGVIGEHQKNYQDKLPPGIKQEMTEPFLGPDNLWRWHLKSDYIKDEEERKKYANERKQWN